MDYYTDPESVAFSGDQSNSSDGKTTRKTDLKSDPSKVEDDKFKKQQKQEVVKSGESNVLNGYRSITYNWTLAGLKKDYLKDPKLYRESELDIVILKSGGKGPSSMFLAGASAEETRQSQEEVYENVDEAAKKIEAVKVKNYNADAVAGFNQRSPGRFDMFIESVDIDTLMAFSASSNNTLPTQIKFEVIEPYSVNGFIEALHVASLAAGYTGYLQASFVLKLEFWGYPDDVDLPEPELIPNSTRYFPFGLTGIEVDITERGTRYRCNAVPYNERAFGEPNVIKKPIKMSGLKVKEILENFFKNLNDQIQKIDKDSKSGPTSNQHNTYKILFKKWDDQQGWVDDPSSKIGDSKLVEIFKDNALYAMVDPSSTTKPNAYKTNGSTQPTPSQQSKVPESIKYTPGQTVVQFAENTNVNDVITSVIRDSEYVRNILKNLKGSIDQFGMLEYFMVRIEVENRDVIDEVSKKPFQDFTYVVTPYKIHYSKVPNYGADQIKEEDLKKLSLREYNYIYTGKNVDVLDFKLNFNTLFFEAVPASMGNKDTPASKTGAAPNNSSNVKTSGTSPDDQSKNEVPLNRTVADAGYTKVNSSGPNASQPLDDPYGALAKSMHNAIIDSKASMITGEMTILGDPFYLVTGGMGNFNPSASGNGKVSDGSVNQLLQEVLVTINFRNPIDINSFNEGGMMYFDPQRVPFSGVYRVTKVSNYFKEGVFKQKLEILRVPGQILDADLRPSDPADRIKLEPAPEDQVKPDVSRELSPSQRADSSSVFNLLNRGTPSPTGNFTNAIGGLGGSNPTDLNRTYGLVSRTGSLISNSAVINQPLPTDVASNARLNTSGLGALAQQALSNPAVLAVAANVLTGNVPAKRALGVLAGAAIGSLISSSNKRSNVGSGIGAGATVDIPSAANFVNDPTALDVKFESNFDSTQFPQGRISETYETQSQNLGQSAIDAVSSIGKGVSNLVKNIGSNISRLTGSSADPNGIGASVGLDVSKLSGLSPNLQSKSLSQITSLISNTPQNVNLSQASDNGVALQYMSSAQIQNLPPTAPYASAPPPETDVGYVNSVVRKGGIPALENLYGVSNVSKISTNILPAGSLASAISNDQTASFNPYGKNYLNTNAVDLAVSNDKMLTVKNQLSGFGLSNITDRNIAGSVTGQFGSKSSGSPLDRLVGNAFNDPNAPPYTGTDPIVRARLGLPPAVDDMGNEVT